MNTVQAGGGAGSLLMFLILAAMFIFVLFSGRSQKKREMERQAKVDALQKGDAVILPGGIVGTVAGFKDKAVEVKVAEGVKLTVLKSGIVGFLNNAPETTGGNN